MPFIIFSKNNILKSDSNLNRSVQLFAEEADDNPSPTQFLINSTSFYNLEETTKVTINNETITFAVQCLNFFNFYYLALIIFLGMVGNTLNFLVFTRTHLKLRSSSYYLAALALADLGYLRLAHGRLHFREAHCRSVPTSAILYVHCPSSQNHHWSLNVCHFFCSHIFSVHCWDHRRWVGQWS